MILIEVPAVLGTKLTKQLAEEMSIKIANNSSRHTTLAFEAQEELDAFRSLVKEEYDLELIDNRTTRQ